jgi:hypothetical protein
VDAGARAEAAAHETFAAADEAHRNTLSALNALDLRLRDLRTRAEGARDDLTAIAFVRDLEVLPEPLDGSDRIACPRGDFRFRRLVEVVGSGTSIDSSLLCSELPAQDGAETTT